MAGIVVQDSLQDLGMHQGPVHKCRGHDVSGEKIRCGIPPDSFRGLLNASISVWVSDSSWR